MIYLQVRDTNPLLQGVDDLKDLTHLGLTEVIYLAKRLIEEAKELLEVVEG